MSDITVQGELSLSGTIIYKVPANKKAKVMYIQVNNPIAYDITISKFDRSRSSLIDLYTLNLSAGDTVKDSTTYVLDFDDYIKITPTSSGTTYLAYIVEE